MAYNDTSVCLWCVCRQIGSVQGEKGRQEILPITCSFSNLPVQIHWVTTAELRFWWLWSIQIAGSQASVEFFFGLNYIHVPCGLLLFRRYHCYYLHFVNYIMKEGWHRYSKSVFSLTFKVRRQGTFLVAFVIKKWLINPSWMLPIYDTSRESKLHVDESTYYKQLYYEVSVL